MPDADDVPREYARARGWPGDEIPLAVVRSSRAAILAHNVRRRGPDDYRDAEPVLVGDLYFGKKVVPDVPPSEFVFRLYAAPAPETWID